MMRLPHSYRVSPVLYAAMANKDNRSLGFASVEMACSHQREGIASSDGWIVGSHANGKALILRAQFRPRAKQ